MIGFISIISLLAIIIGWFVIWCGWNIEDLNRNNITTIATNYKKKIYPWLIVTVCGLLLDVLIVIDKAIWEPMYRKNMDYYCSGHCTTEYQYVFSPIFRQDFTEVWDMTIWCVWIGIFLGIFVLIYQIVKYISAEDFIRVELETQENKQAKEKERKELMDKNNKYEQQCILSIIGRYDKVIFIDGNEETGYKGWKNAFYVNVESQTIIASGRLIAFKDILSCSYSDNSQVLYNQTAHSTTTTDSGNMVGRAIVGGVIAGDAGAIIGGSTAQKNTTTNIQTKSTTIHDYAIIITTKDIINPTCEIHCGENEKAMNDIVGTINAIISHN